MKPVDVKLNTYIDFGIESSDKDPKFNVADYVRILKQKCFCESLHSKLV